MKKKCDELMEIYSRVVGYYRPTQSWNKGKLEEFKLRKTFKLPEKVMIKCEDCKHYETEICEDCSINSDRSCSCHINPPCSYCEDVKYEEK